jgi:ATP-dependent helicase/nuclease subunit A
LRYWINPFGLQIRNTPLDERMNDSPHKAANIERARREDVRLLYVGLTRARDYLVFCSGYEPTRWLNRVFQGDDEKTTLSPDTHETPWEWEGRFLDARTETFVFPREFPYAEWEPAPVDFLAPRAGKVHYPAHDIDLRRESFAEVFNGAIGQQWTYAGAEAGPEGVDAYAWGKMTKAFLLAFHPQDAPEHHLDMAKGHLMRFIDASSQEAPALLVAAARAFFRLLHETFAPRRIQRKYPIRYAYGGRHFETVLDFVLETEQGLVLVQNSGFAGGPGKWNNHALGLLDWCGLSELALRTVFADSPVRVLIHFVLGGALLEVTTAAKTTGLKL